MKPITVMGPGLQPALVDVLSLPRIDADQFQMLVETGEDAAAALLQELFGLFQEEAGPRLENLAAAVAAVDRKAVARHAHALAGSSANLGAQRLWRLCKLVEEAAPDGDWAFVTGIHDLLADEYRATLEAFSESIARLS